MTPVRHVRGVAETLEAAGDVTYMDDPSPASVAGCIADYNALFTNPNKSNVYIGRELMDVAPRLRVVGTASTGTNHIDTLYARQKGLTVLSLTEERAVINRISSTAEHAFALMMASVRRIVPAWESVRRGEWDYVPYIGRQLDALTVGVVGFGRLGSKFARYCVAFGCRVLACDPFKAVRARGVEQVEADTLWAQSDVISLHVHVTPETTRMVGRGWLAKAKPNLLLVNASRGDVVDEAALMEFLTAHPEAFYATDVLANETEGKLHSQLRAWALTSRQLLITPHIGGMTAEGQEIAFNHAASMLSTFLSERYGGGDRRRL